MSYKMHCNEHSINIVRSVISHEAISLFQSMSLWCSSWSRRPKEGYVIYAKETKLFCVFKARGLVAVNILEEDFDEVSNTSISA